MRQTMEQHKAEYRARPLSERLHMVFAEVAGPCAQKRLEMLAASTKTDFKPSPPRHTSPHMEDTQDDHLH